MPILQNDGGTSGDAGTEANAKALGQDPSIAASGCLDTDDTKDEYTFSNTEGMIIEIEVSTPAGREYDLTLLGSWGFPIANGTVNGSTVTLSTADAFDENQADSYSLLIEQKNGEGDYELKLWTNKTLTCDDLWPEGQNDAGTGRDAPQSHSDSPTNIGLNQTGTYTGCVGKNDDKDVISFEVPINHVLTVRITPDDETNLFLCKILNSSGESVTGGEEWEMGESEESTRSTDYDGVAGTYHVEITTFSGSGNYTLEVWTNYTPPGVNLKVTNMSGLSDTQPGSTGSVTVEITNAGQFDYNGSSKVEVLLSVNMGLSWTDAVVGNATISALQSNQSIIIEISITVPEEIIEGPYYYLGVADVNNEASENYEDDNHLASEETVMIGSMTTACGTQSDAGRPGDAPNETADAPRELGVLNHSEFIGCLGGEDDADDYSVTVAEGETFSVRIVPPPGTTIFVDVFDPEGSRLEGENSEESDLVFSTKGKENEGLAGSYTIRISLMASLFGGDTNDEAGYYRLILLEPVNESIFVDCEESSQNTLIELGDDPTVESSGCFDQIDDEVVYHFNLTNQTGASIILKGLNNNELTYELLDNNGTVIQRGESLTEYIIIISPSNNLSNEFRLIITTLEDLGHYSLSIDSDKSATEDWNLAIDELSCNSPINRIDRLTYSFLIKSNGSAILEQVSWRIELLNSEGTVVSQIGSATISASQLNAENSVKQSGGLVLDTFIENGQYSCLGTVEIVGNITESYLLDNNATTKRFKVSSNDFDGDGFVDTPDGHGIIDDCPADYGLSKEDRKGCPDSDGDGWSDVSDWNNRDSTQWKDSDNDGFGDNASGNNGDQCPNDKGVANGVGGDGCPDAIVHNEGLANAEGLYWVISGFTIVLVLALTSFMVIRKKVD